MEHPAAGSASRGRPPGPGFGCAVPQAPGRTRRVRQAGHPDLRERVSQRRGHPAGRRPAHAAEVAALGARPNGYDARVTTETYTLPDLPYDYSALEPHISARIMELHHDKHHAAYVKGANTALERLQAGAALVKPRHLEKNRRSTCRPCAAQRLCTNPRRQPDVPTVCSPMRQRDVGGVEISRPRDGGGRHRARCGRALRRSAVAADRGAAVTTPRQPRQARFRARLERGSTRTTAYENGNDFFEAFGTW